MKRTNSIEVVGLGEFNLISIKQRFPEFKPISKEGKYLEAKREGSLSYYWIDDEGKKYTASEVFFDINGKKIQKIKKTEKVEHYEVIDKAEIIGNFMCDAYYICDVSDTIMQRWNKEIGNDKAITFIFKKSSRGLKFHRTYIFKFQGVLICVAGLGYVSEGIKEYSLMKETAKKNKVSVINQEVTISSEEVEKDISSLIKI